MSKSSGDVIDALVSLLKLVLDAVASCISANRSVESNFKLLLLLSGLFGSGSTTFEDPRDFIEEASGTLLVFLNSSDVCRDIPKP